MKRTILIIITLFFLSITLHAQVWQHHFKHHGYACSMLKTSNEITVLAAKGMAGDYETLFIKIKVPYDWGNISTGCVKYFRKNLISGDMDSRESFFNYKNGWLYFVEDLGEWCTGRDKRGNYPCNTYTITLYENNDHGSSAGKKTVVNISLDKLNTAQMKMNEVAFETHW
jgi:hypothetical protein